MKYLILVLIVLSSCSTKEQTIEELTDKIEIAKKDSVEKTKQLANLGKYIGSDGEFYNTVVIDSCEYLQRGDTDYVGYQGFGYGMHKGNCKNHYYNSEK